MTRREQAAESTPAAAPVLSTATELQGPPPPMIRLRVGGSGQSMGLRTVALRRVLEIAAQRGWDPAGTWRLTNTVRLPDGSVEQRYSKGGGLVVDEAAGRQLGVGAYVLPRHRIDRQDAWALLVVLTPLVELGGELADDETARLLTATIQANPGADLDISGGTIS